MATRYNPYALDPALSAGIGNLTRALIGSASDDAAIARGQASMAQAGASNALARLRNQQTKTEAANTALSEAFNLNKDAILSDPLAVNKLAGLVLPMSEYVEKDVAFDDPLISKGQGVSPGMATAIMGDIGEKIPYKGQAPINYSPEALKGIVGTMFGSEPSNMNQATSGFKNIQDMTRSKLIENLLLNSDQTNDRIARILQGKSLGQFFDMGSAKEFAEITAQTKRDVQTIKSDASILENREKMDNNITLKTMEERGLGERQKSQLLSEELIENNKLQHDTKMKVLDRALEKEIETLKIETKDKTDRIIAENKLKLDQAQGEDKIALRREMLKLREENRMKIEQMKNATVKWKFKNQPITTTFDQVHIIGEELAREKNIPKQTEGRYKGLYIIDGGTDPNSIIVKVNEGQTVSMGKKLAEELGVRQDPTTGRYVLKGVKSGTSATKEADENRKFNEQFEDDMIIFTTEGQLPSPKVLSWMRSDFKQRIDNLRKSNPELSFSQAYQQVGQTLFTDTTNFGASMFKDGENVPNYILDRAIALNNSNKFTASKQEQFENMLKNTFGYSEDIVEQIIQYIAESE
tara:strand:+ start:5478 stop:7220 length:1743 start_codon:yes stop_codon:yes gene_type:complete